MGDGRYERILKDVLDDRTLTDAECRLACYLAAKPPGWTIYPAFVQKELKRSLRHWVLPTLKLLHARGWVVKSGGRIPGQANSVLTYRLNRDAIVRRPEACDLGSAHSDITPDLGSAHSVVTDPVMTETAEHIKRTDVKREQPPTEPLRGSVPPTVKRGTRVPEDFLDQLRADPAQTGWFRAECPDVDGRVENQKFMNYWLAKTGKDATKRDWVRTWRNWMLRAQQDTGKYKSRGADRLVKANQVVQKNRVNGKPSAALTAMAAAAGMNTTTAEESRREITS